MMTAYGDIPNQMFDNYFQKLISRVFKILPMREEEIDTLSVYIHSLLSELIGNEELIVILNDDAEFLRLIATLEYLSISCEDVGIFKREVFKCISIIEQLKQKYERSG